MRELQDVQERDERRRRARDSAESRLERVRSRQAHRRLSPSEALRLARERFRPYTDAAPYQPLRLRSGEEVLDYRGELAAVVKNAAAKRAVVSSTLPLRSTVGSGDPKPVDLRLEDHGDRVSPVNPLVSTTIFKDPAKGLRFARRDYGFRVAAGAGKDAQVVEDKLFFADGAGPDADLLVAPTPSGAGVGVQLRSEDAPEATTLSFDLPQGSELRLVAKPSADDSNAERQRRAPPGAAEIVRSSDGERLALIKPPSAFDADGEPLDASYEVGGDDLVVRHPHHGKDLHYPVLVDPILDNYQLDGNGARAGYDPFNGWIFATHNPTGPTPIEGFKGTPSSGSGLYPWGNGLYIHTDPNINLAAGWFGQWAMGAPRESFITRADFGYIHHSPQGTCLIEGVWAPRRNNWDKGSWWDFSYQPHLSAPSEWTYWSGHPDSRYNACSAQLNNYKAHVPTSFTSHNGMVFGVQVFAGGFKTQAMDAFMYGASIWFDDRDRPRVVSAPDTPWRDSGTADVTVRARDDVTNTNTTPATLGPDSGLGVRRIWMLDSATPGPTTSFDRFLMPSGQSSPTATASTCTGTNHAQCPGDATATFGVDTAPVPEGVNQVLVGAEDPLQKQTLDTRTEDLHRRRSARQRARALR